MKLRQLSIALSVVGVSTLGFVGCGGSSNSYPELVKYIVISDPAVNCDSVVVGATSATRVADGVYQVVATASGKVLGSSCIDSVTGADVGDMESDGDFDDSGDSEVVSPVTTLIEKAVTAGLTQAQARASVAAALGVSQDSLDDDPVRNATVAVAASKVVSALAVIKAAGGNVNTALTGLATQIANEGGATSVDTLLADPVVIASIEPTVAGDADDIASIASTVVAVLNGVDTSADNAVKSVAAVVKTIEDNSDNLASDIENDTVDTDDITTAAQGAADNPDAVIPGDITPADPDSLPDGGVNPDDVPPVSGASGSGGSGQ